MADPSTSSGDLALVVRILYTNWRGETAWRRIIPRALRFSSTEWHSEPQWLLDAWDIEKEAERSFALREIRAWLRPDDPLPAEEKAC